MEERTKKKERKRMPLSFFPFFFCFDESLNNLAFFSFDETIERRRCLTFSKSPLSPWAFLFRLFLGRLRARRL